MKKLSALALLFIVAFVSFSFTEKKPVNKKKSSSSISKNLVFPVAGKKSRVGSFWGDVRDGGARKHQGIDIFAKTGTPVVAICDGVIEEKGTTPRGGKILWLRSATHGWSVYYAHLDQFKVNQGQFVKKGQVIGTVGKTGNAKTTPAHLHFGIYTNKGAVNPLPYVKNSKKVAAPVSKPAKASVAKNSKKKTVSKTATAKSRGTASRQVRR